MTVRVALDIQVLQTAGRRKTQWPGWPGWPPGSTLLAEIQDWAERCAVALAGAGRLAAAVLAPEYPPPPELLAGRPDAPETGSHTGAARAHAGVTRDMNPAGVTRTLLHANSLRWYNRAEVRRLVETCRSAGDTLVHLVPAPFLDADPDDPAGRVVSTTWADAGVPRVVTVYDLDPLEDPEEWFRSAARRARYQARAEWVAASDLIVAATGRAAEQVVRLLGCPPERVVGPGPRRDGTENDLADPTGADLGPLIDRLLQALDARYEPVPDSGPNAGPPGGHRAPRRLPPRIALVGPFPPQGGGIGAYNDHLLSALASSVTPTGHRPEFDAVPTAAEGWGSHEWQPPLGVGTVHPESLGTDVRPASYDHLIHTLGNSSGHLVTVEAALRHPGWLWLHETRLPAVATTALADLDDERFAQSMAWLLDRSYPGRAPLAAARAAGRSHLALADAGVGLTAPLVARSRGVLVNSTAARHFLLLDLPPLAWHPPVHVLPPGCPPVRPDRRARRGARLPGGEDRLAVAFGVVSMSKRPDLLVDAAACSGWRLAFVGPCPPILAELIHDRAGHHRIADRVEVAGSVDDDSWWEWMDRATVAVQLRERSSGELSAAVLDALSAGLPVVTNLPSAADYPDGTVVRLASSDPDVGEIAAALDRLAGDPAILDRLSRAGQDYAAGHQMADLARALLQAVGEP